MFDGVAEPLPAAVRAEMDGVSWHAALAPPGFDELALLRMPYWGFDGAVHRGELVVAARVADDVLGAFGALYAARFPIERMERVERFGADDGACMAANNTSAFNCRRVMGSKRLSNHALGVAIDINPVQNPCIRDGVCRPEAGSAYLDRDDVRPGMITADGPVVAAFAAIGFEWGGFWNNPRDYHHFQIGR